MIEIRVEHICHKLTLYRGFVPNCLEVMCRLKVLVSKLQRVESIEGCAQVYFTKVQASSDFTGNGDPNHAFEAVCLFGEPSENRLPALASRNGKPQIVNLSCSDLVAGSTDSAVGGDRRHHGAPPPVFTELKWVRVTWICVALGILWPVIVP